MNSIPQTATFRLVENGLIVSDQEARNTLGFTDETRANRQAGDINGFSTASRLRFRKILAVSRPDYAGIPFGLCFTIPGKEIIEQSVASDLWWEWSKNHCSRYFKQYPMIWRVELTKNRQPHWHLVTWLPDSVEGRLALDDIKYRWRSLVLDRLNITLTDRQMKGFLYRGAYAQNLGRVGQGAADYLAPTLDHETKHKQEQLGWRGRQWGIINRKHLVKGDGAPLSLSGDVVGRIMSRFGSEQDRRRSTGNEYVGAGISEHARFPSVLYGRDAEVLERIIREEVGL